MRLSFLIILVLTFSNSFGQDSFSINLKNKINCNKIFYKSNDYAIGIDSFNHIDRGCFKQKLWRDIKANKGDTVWLNNYFRICNREIRINNFQSQLMNYLIYSCDYVLYLKENRSLTSMQLISKNDNNIITYSFIDIINGKQFFNIAIFIMLSHF